jgi:hypothetical protein
VVNVACPHRVAERDPLAGAQAQCFLLRHFQPGLPVLILLTRSTLQGGVYCLKEYTPEGRQMRQTQPVDLGSCFEIFPTTDSRQLRSLLIIFIFQWVSCFCLNFCR